MKPDTILRWIREDKKGRKRAAHYHDERPHQSLDNEPLKKPKQRGRPKKQHDPIDQQIVPLSEVRCKQRLGGLLKSYSRQAA